MITAKMNVVHLKFSKTECIFSSPQDAYRKKKKQKPNLKTEQNDTFLAKKPKITSPSNLDKQRNCLHISKSDQLKGI